MRRFAPFLSVLAATLLIMAVAFADGRPSVFYDSHSYDVMGQNLIQVVQDFPESVEFKMKPGVKWGDPPVTSDRLIDAAVEGARSPYYGVLLHGTYLIGSLWLLAAIQSALAAWVAYLLWRTLAPRAPLWSFLVLVGGVVVGSSLSFFATFAMPDVFAGIGGGAAVLLLCQADRLKRGEKIGLWLLTAYSLAIHRSHLLTAIGLVVIGYVLLLCMGLKREVLLKRAGTILAAALVAWMSGAAFGALYKARTGLPLSHPPFLMARVLADGPGQDYMHTACAQDHNAYAVCFFAKNINSHSTENLVLWSTRRNLGVFNIGNRPTRVRLENEESAFVLGTIEQEPLAELGAALSNWGRQLLFFQVDDPLRNPAAYLVGRYWPTTTLPKLIPNFNACRPPLSCKPPFPQQQLAWWHGAVLVATLAFLVWRFSRRDVRSAFSSRGLKRNDESARVLATLALLLVVVVVNAAVCGMLSGPFGRYQARVVWLAPLAAGLAACALPVSLAALVKYGRRGFGLVNGVWDRLRMQPVFGRFLPPLNGHVMRFGLVGVLGFVVDGVVLQTMMYVGLNPIAARAISFPVAVCATWLANRTFTFRDRAGQSKVREASTYVAVQLVGGAANFAVYSALVHGFPVFAEWPVAALAFGSAAGMAINYLGSKHIVFRSGATAP
ncbi:MAG TPA: GtrA family protein [Caulobacteraceae bacterium]|nr:GtrA family protein [Caulobacteraceae bacterium]